MDVESASGTFLMQEEPGLGHEKPSGGLFLWSQPHFLLDPIQVPNHVCVNARRVFLSTALAPANDPDQSHATVVQADQRPPRITLWGEGKRKQ